MIEFDGETLMYIGGAMILLFVVLIILNSILNSLIPRYQTISKSYVMAGLLWVLFILALVLIPIGSMKYREEQKARTNQILMENGIDVE